MYFWDGTNWVEPQARRPAPRRESRTANWVATGLMLLVAALFVVPFSTTFAATRKASPTLSVGCSGCATASMTVGSTLMVHGTGFTPSAGGQQVMIWVGYPNDYCVGSTCHGFYMDPWVAADGTFNVTVDSATVAPGTGNVTAYQYDAKRDKLLSVASVGYTVH